MRFYLQPFDGAVRKLGTQPGLVFTGMTYAASRQEVVYPLDSEIRSDATAPAEIHPISVVNGKSRPIVTGTGGQSILPTVLGEQVAFPMAAVNGLSDVPGRRSDVAGRHGAAQTVHRADADGRCYRRDPWRRFAFRCKDSVYSRICVIPADANARPADTLVSRSGREISAIAGSPNGAQLAWVTYDAYGKASVETAAVADTAHVSTYALLGVADAAVPLGTVREVSWRSDNVRLSGLLITPPDYRPGTKYANNGRSVRRPCGRGERAVRRQSADRRPDGAAAVGQPQVRRFVPDYRESGMAGWKAIADGQHVLTAEDPLPTDLRGALAQIT